MSERDGVRNTRSSSRGSRSASRTWPIDVAYAGKRVPMCTDKPMIFGTATRAVYTMSDPSSCDIELDSFVVATSDSRCGCATSHSPCAAMYAVPSSSTLGVNEYCPSTERTYPSRSSVMSKRRTVGRASFVDSATSLTDSDRCDSENARITSSPRASASTKSGSVSRRAITPHGTTFADVRAHCATNRPMNSSLVSVFESTHNSPTSRRHTP